MGPIRVLFAQKSVDAAATYAVGLARHGIHLIAMPHERALQAAIYEDDPPAAIVVEGDLRANAWQLATLLRAAKRLAYVPIIALCQVGTPDGPLLARRAGCDLYLEQPCSPEELAVAIETLVQPASRPTSRPAAEEIE
jgi:DNA-binding response OmpR family regulator